MVAKRPAQVVSRGDWQKNQYHSFVPFFHTLVPYPNQRLKIVFFVFFNPHHTFWLRERGPAPPTPLLLAPSFQPSHLLAVLPKPTSSLPTILLLIIVNTDTDLLIVLLIVKYKKRLGNILISAPPPANLRSLPERGGCHFRWRVA